MVVTFIILLVVAGVVINLFLKTIGGGVDRPAGAVREEIKSKCKLECKRIQNAPSISSKREAIIDYCLKSFNYDIGDVQSDIIYSGPLGVNSFCKDKGRCFNFGFVNCMSGGQEVDAEMCRNIMCKTYSKLGLNKSVVEEKIERQMSPGDCSLRMGSRAGDNTIETKTWWQKYFHNVTCTNVR